MARRKRLLFKLEFVVSVRADQLVELEELVRARVPEERLDPEKDDPDPLQSAVFDLLDAAMWQVCDEYGLDPEETTIGRGVPAPGRRVPMDLIRYIEQWEKAHPYEPPERKPSRLEVQ